jgi:hypothetical protein
LIEQFILERAFNRKPLKQAAEPFMRRSWPAPVMPVLVVRVSCAEYYIEKYLCFCGQHREVWRATRSDRPDRGETAQKKVSARPRSKRGLLGSGIPSHTSRRKGRSPQSLFQACTWGSVQHDSLAFAECASVICVTQVTAENPLGMRNFFLAWLGPHC